MTEFERIVRVTGAYDKRSNNPQQNYGICACRIFFILKGRKGAVQFLVGTNWHLSHVQREYRAWQYNFDCKSDRIEPSGWAVEYHALEPRYDGQTSMECDLLEGGRCYYDGSSLRAYEWVPKFIEGGTDWLWPALEAEYHDLFDVSETEEAPA